MNNKFIAAASYIVFFASKFLGQEKDQLVNYHMKQGFGLLIAALSMQGIISIAGYWGFPQYMLAWVVRIILIILVLAGWQNSMAGKQSPLPVIGKYSEKAF